MANIKIKIGGVDKSFSGIAVLRVPATGFPIEVATETEMDSVLVNATAADVGKIYKYTGTTGTYTQGELYILQEG
ncbi:MAG: hypothetical protein KH382_07970 [Clostridiales bacterium]|nr:hypothetical protein [Clostridiales bacterium]